MRLKYATNVRIVRMPCTGKTDIRVLLEAFLGGADGVIVVGCEEGDCHFLKGNIKAKKRVARAKTFVKAAGLDPERLEMHHVEASQGQRFARLVDDFTQKIRELGPSEARGGGGGARAAAAVPGGADEATGAEVAR